MGGRLDADLKVRSTRTHLIGNRSSSWQLAFSPQIVVPTDDSTDKRSSTTNHPNRDNDPEYIVRLFGQVITVSLATMRIVNVLPSLATDA
ncbi:MAG TPA: hypothetical protein VKG65_00420 [Terriglobales bacterium]|nr:hypothetical protein [Terriglobales bacterium]